MRGGSSSLREKGALGVAGAHEPQSRAAFQGMASCSVVLLSIPCAVSEWASCWACRAGPAQHHPGAQPVPWAGTGLGKVTARGWRSSGICSQLLLQPLLNPLHNLCLPLPFLSPSPAAASGGVLSVPVLDLSPGHPAESLLPPEGELATGSTDPTLPSPCLALPAGHSHCISLS